MLTGCWLWLHIYRAGMKLAFIVSPNPQREIEYAHFPKCPTLPWHFLSTLILTLFMKWHPEHRNTIPKAIFPAYVGQGSVHISAESTVHEQIWRRTMCCIYDLVYSLETHIKHLHWEAWKGYKTQHTVLMSGWRAATEVFVCIRFKNIGCWTII